MTAATFTIAFPPGVTVGKWTRAFAQRHPDVALEVVRTSVADQQRLLDDAHIDMGFVRLPIDPDGLHVIPLYSENVVVTLHEEHLLTLEKSIVLADLADESVITGEPDEATLRAVAGGTGIAIMPQSIAKALRRRDVVAMLIEDAEPSQVALAWRDDATNPLIDEFVGIVRGRGANSSRTPEVAAAEAAAAVTARAARNAAAAKAARVAKGAKGAAKSPARTSSQRRQTRKPGRRR
ncbi:MAG TPA: LysR family substrate-binding domain-containing protein [Microbacteriaceae bacterium]|jgi:DNA-binding transcriptional LysR family regulator|nr:LysR family substrate-binding domain-containing protein [Microbacteriaceae bacterium]